MADPPPYPDSNSDTGDDTRVAPDRGSTTSTPRWVKVFVIIVIVLVLLFVITHLTGGGLGGHPPEDHAPPFKRALIAAGFAVAGIALAAGLFLLQRHRTRGATAMTMPPVLRKFALTAHVISSVSWLGAVASFLALAVAGLTSRDAELARAAYLAMELTTWFVIVPLAFASLLTGLVQSLGTEWGLFRHYWIPAKLLITIFATILLLAHTQPIGILAGVAKETILSGAHVGRLQVQLVADAGAALLVLLVATKLAVYKPRGMTRYGRRKQREQRTLSQP